MPRVVPDGQARGDNQEAPRKPAALGPPHSVDGLPRDQHGHHGGFACTGGKFQSQPIQFRVRIVVGPVQVIEKTLAGLPHVGRYLGQPDCSFRRLNLAKERAEIAEAVVPPMVKEAGCLRGDLPVVGVGKGAPSVNLVSDGIDDRGVVVCLFLGGNPLVIKPHLGLRGRSFLLLWLRNGRDEICASTAFGDPLGRLSRFIQLPMPPRIFLGGIQDGAFKELIFHFPQSPNWCALVDGRIMRFWSAQKVFNPGRPNALGFGLF